MKKESLINNILIFTYLILITLRYIYDIGFYIIIIFSFSIFISQINILLKLSSKILGVIAFLILFTGLNIYIHHYPPWNIFELFGGVGVALLCYRTKLNVKLLSYIIIGLCLFILFQVYVKHVDPNDIIARGSRNFAGAIVIILTIFYTACLYRQERKFNLIILSFVLFIMLLLIGRSNIISALYILLIGLYFHLKYISIYKKWLFISFSSALSIYLVTKYLDFFTISTTRFTTEGVESHGRDLIMSNYLSKLNFTTIFSGINRYEAPFSMYNGNLHNSFLNGHSNMGLAFILLMVCVTILIFKKLAVKESRFYVALVIGLLLRGSTDILFFFDNFDFVFYFLILLVLYSNDRFGYSFST